MRTGVVVSYNSIISCGFIKDGNKQKIRFFNENPKLIFKRLDVVRFSVGFVDNSLRAVNITPVVDVSGSTVSLAVNIN